jgi:hypothetical protein
MKGTTAASGGGKAGAATPLVEAGEPSDTEKPASPSNAGAAGSDDHVSDMMGRLLLT